MTACCVCNGTLRLLGDTCPLCEGDPSFLDDVPEPKASPAVAEVAKEMVWEVNLGSWVRFDVDTEALIADAKATGGDSVVYRARGQEYAVDLHGMQQVNRRTGVRRSIRCVELCVEVPDKFVVPVPQRSKRVSRLVDHLLSPAVAVQLPLEAAEEPARLSEEEVHNLFKKHVPGVERLLYRDMPGKLALNFITTAYSKGLRAFQGTDIHSHLLSLIRFIVHQFYDEKVTVSRYLRDVAEAFTDCQAVQARVVERVGLELRGVRADFQGLAVRLVAGYKGVALQMLAAERIAQRCAVDDGNPTHYENRLTADLGDLLGLSKDDVRRARLDEHASARYQRLTTQQAQQAAERCRELFDVEACLQAFVAEVNSFNAESLPESLSRLFLDWASAHMSNKHVIFDEDTCTRVDISQALALAIFEALFLRELGAETEEMYGGHCLSRLFVLDATEKKLDSPKKLADCPKKDAVQPKAASQGSAKKTKKGGHA